MDGHLEIPPQLLQPRTSFHEPTDREFKRAVGVLANLEFNPPKDPNKVVEALAVVKQKLDAVPANSPQHEHMMHLLAKLCPDKKGKVEDVDIHSALLSLQAKAADYKTTFAYSNTALAQSFMKGFVGSLNKNATQAQSYG